MCTGRGQGSEAGATRRRVRPRPFGLTKRKRRADYRRAALAEDPAKRYLLREGLGADHLPGETVCGGGVATGAEAGSADAAGRGSTDAYSTSSGCTKRSPISTGLMELMISA